MIPGRLESLIRVPAGGAAVSATNSGGGPTTATVPAADYFLTSSGGLTSLLSTAQTQLQASRPPNPGLWSVALSTTTGLVTIDCPSGAVVTKTGGTGFAWDAGVSSTQSIAGDGYLEFTASEAAKSRKLGFATAAIGVDQTLIKWGLYLKADNIIYTTELGAEVSTGLAYAAGDTLTVKRTGTVVTYLKNGTVIATSALPSAGALVVGAAALSAGATLCAIRLYSAGVRSALTLSASLTAMTVTATTFSLAWTNATLRDLLGFTADIVAMDAPQTGTKQARGLWLPDCQIFVRDSDPRLAPVGTDNRSTVSPTGSDPVTLGGTAFRQHRNVLWSHIPQERIREQSATYANASWRQFWDDTQLGRGLSWFPRGSNVLIIDHTSQALGSDMQVTGPTNGWHIVNATDVEPKRVDADGFAGWWSLELPQLLAEDA